LKASHTQQKVSRCAAQSRAYIYAYICCDLASISQCFLLGCHREEKQAPTLTQITPESIADSERDAAKMLSFIYHVWFWVKTY